MRNWELTDDNDLSITNGKITTVDKLRALRSRIQSALQTFKGETEDENFGVDYFGIILENISPIYKIQEFKRVIESLDGVYGVEGYNYKQDKKTGSVTYSFTIKSVYGNINIDQTVEV
ncbi:MAG: hypothetical protein SOZ42_00905 [Candidatus Enterosoma sp.]|nr:hypothetical protein [Candidatus Enterosoma sp.]